MKPKSLPLVASLLLTPFGWLFAIPGDIDNDGLRDAVETNTGVYVSPSDTGSSPTVADTDGDSLPDGTELVLGTSPVSATSKIKRPNIIYILADDMGYGDVGCFWQNQRTGPWKFATPGLDAMAAEGAKMTHTYVGAPICVSSRCSFLQGQHQGHAAIRDAQFDFALPNNHSVSSVLRSAGYRTVHIGKAGVVGRFDKPLTTAVAQNIPAHPLKRGFDRYFGYLTHEDGHEHYPRNASTIYRANICDDYQPINDAYQDMFAADAFTAFAKKTIIEETQQHSERPFFIYLSYDTPHFYGQYAPTATYPAGKGLNGGLQWTGSPSYVNTATNDASKIDNPNNFHPSVSSTWYPAAKKYVSMVRRLDDSVSDILQTLKDLGIDDNTLVVFTSDNGPADTEVYPPWFQSYGPFEGVKGDLLEGGIRVPTIAWWPGTIAGTNQLSSIREIARPTGNWDWLPTFAELARVPAPSFTDGVSLLPTLSGQGSQADRGFLYFEMSRGNNVPNFPDFTNHGGEAKWQMQAIRIGDFMGIRLKVENPTDPWRIYNVVTDPKQGIDVAASRPDLRQEMQRLSTGACRRGLYVSRSYENWTVPASPVGTMTNGLLCKSFHGTWPWLPDFRDMTAASESIVSSVSAAPRSRPDDVGLSFQGYISIPTTGPYTFKTDSDGATCVWLDEARVIDNDFNFSASKTASPITLEAGFHPIRVHYRHLGGNASLQLSYSGPGITMRPIPASAFFLEGPPPELRPDAINTTRGTEVTANLLANDTSTLPLTLVSAGPTLLGTTSTASNQFKLTPTTIGYDEFPYVATNGFTQYTSHVVATVLFDNEVWLPFEEGAGSTVNGMGGTGTVVGNLSGFANPASAWTSGRFHHALSFDGIDDHVDLPGLPLPTGQQPRTFSCWLKTASKSSPELQALFSYGSNITGGRFVVRLNNEANVSSFQALKLEVGSGDGQITGTTPLNDGVWHHVTVVVDDHNGSGNINVNETKLWVDGRLDPVASTEGRVLATGATLVPCLGGSNHNDGYNFTGKLDDVRLFNRALSDTEVQDLYARRPVYLTVPVDPSGNADDDNDGMTNEAEEIAGTDPGDASSILRIDEFNLSGGSAFIQWMAVPERDYQVEESTNLQTWGPVSGQGPVRIEPPASPGSPSLPPVLSVTFPATLQGPHYYRLKVTRTTP